MPAAEAPLAGRRADGRGRRSGRHAPGNPPAGRHSPLSAAPLRRLAGSEEPRGQPLSAAWRLLDSRGLDRMQSFVRRDVAHSRSQLEGQMITQYRGDRSWRPALDDMRRVHVELPRLSTT